MKKKQSYENLPVWTDSLDLVKSIYVLTSVFPEDEDHIFPKKLHKNAIEIPINIAKAMSEEEERQSYFNQASLHISEIETILTICRKLNFFEEKDIEKVKEQLTKISENLKTLIHRLNR